MKIIVASLAGLALALALVLSGAFGVAALGACATGTIDVQRAARLNPIEGYEGDRLAHAAVILNTVTEAGIDPRAGVIAVTAAIARTGLRNIDSDDASGIYGLPIQFGTAAELLDPRTATSRFLATLTSVNDWVQIPPADAAAAAIPGSSASDYTDSYAAAAAITQALRSTASSCAISGDRMALAQELVDAADEGRLRGLLPDHIREIRWIAHGDVVPNCGIDTRILQILVITVRHFDQVTISDINRQCTGQIAGAGTRSVHWLKGGGMAVDFAVINGQITTGADSNSIELIQLLDPIVPAGAQIGQVQCRTAAGIHLELQNFGEFNDTCHHLHLDVFHAEDGLKL